MRPYEKRPCRLHHRGGVALAEIRCNRELGVTDGGIHCDSNREDFVPSLLAREDSPFTGDRETNHASYVGHFLAREATNGEASESLGVPGYPTSKRLITPF